MQIHTETTADQRRAYGSVPAQTHTTVSAVAEQELNAIERE